MLTPELQKKISNREWRLDHLYRIVDKTKRTIPFIPNSTQKRILYSNTRFKKILKPRQVGVSTGLLIDMLDETIFKKNRTSVILAHEQDSIKKLFRIVRFAYDKLPEEIKPALKGDGSMYELYFPEINSRIYVDLESRSDTISRLHVSEMAFMKNPEKVDATMDAVPMKTGQISVETTANGMNHFYDFWQEGNAYEPLFFPWYSHEEYSIDCAGLHKNDAEENITRKAAELGYEVSDAQLNFRRAKIASYSGSRIQAEKRFDQEYPSDDESCFLLSGQSILDRFHIKRLLEKSLEPISERLGLKVYEDPQRGADYVIGADTAEGVGRDWSVGVVVDQTNSKVVAVLRGQWKPEEFAERLVELGNFYQRAQDPFPPIAVERNNHGHTVLAKLNSLQYPAVWHAPDNKPGWLTNAATRPKLIDTFIEAVDRESLLVNDKNILGECLTLIENKGKIEAESGKHDDCVIACAIALQVALSYAGKAFYNEIDEYIRLG